MSTTLKPSPSADNLVLGGYNVLLRRADDAAAAGRHNVGFLETLEGTPQTDVQETFDGYTGAKVLLKRIPQITSVTYSVISKERTLENLRLFYQGDDVSADTQSAADIDGADNKLISDVLLGIAAYTDVVAGRWYELSDAGVTPVHVRNLDPSVPVTVDSLAEGTGFFVDYEEGLIMFAAVPGADHEMTLKWLAIAGSKFETWEFQGVDVENVLIIGVAANGTVIERATIHKARVEPQAGSPLIIEGVYSPVKLNLIQLKHPVNGWGTFFHHAKTL